MRRTLIGWTALAVMSSAAVIARGGEADEMALAERIATLADRFGGASGAAMLKANVLDGAGRLAQKEVRFRRARFGAAETAGDTEAMLASLVEWRKLEPGNLFVQMRLIDVHLVRLQTADQRLDYVKQILDAPSVNPEVRSHAAMRCVRLLLEQSRTQQAMEMLLRSLMLNPMNVDAMRLSRDFAVPAHRLDMFLAMVKANPASVESVVWVAEELADTGMVQESLQWYGHASGISRSLGGLGGDAAKDYAAELLIAGQDRAAAEVTSRLLERDASDPGAWFLTLLAEAQMKDRIEEVKKSALTGLLNRFAAARQRIGVKDATIQPLGAEDVTLPNLDSDKDLLAKAAPETVSDYVAAVSNVAWFLLFHANRPADAEPLLKSLAATGRADAALMDRLEGWRLLQSGKIEQARAKLSPIAQRDALAGVGMVQILRADPGSAAAAGELAKSLAQRYPARLVGAIVRSRVGDLAGPPAPEPRAQSMRESLDQFPREVLKMAASPQEFLAMRIAPLQVGHDFAEPILVEVELRNQQSLPIVLGPSGMVRDCWLDVQCRGLISQWVPGAVFERIEGPIVLASGQSVRWTTRLDRGPLAALLERSVGQSVQMSVFGLTNAVPAENEIVPGPGGIRGRMSQMVERRAASLASDAALKRAQAIAVSGDAVLKLALIDQVAVHLKIAADPEGAAPVKAMEAELTNLLVRLSLDSAPTVRAWARYRMGQVTLDPARLAGERAGDEMWYTRLLAVVLSMDSGNEERASLLSTAANDSDATVRRLALSVPDALSAQKNPQGQPNPRRVP